MDIVCNRIELYTGLQGYINNNIEILIKHELERHQEMFEKFTYGVKVDVFDDKKPQHVKIIDDKEYKLTWQYNLKERYRYDGIEIKIYTNKLVFKDLFVYIKHYVLGIFNKIKHQGYKINDFTHDITNYRLIYKNECEKYKLTFDVHFRYRICKSVFYRSWYYHGDPFGEDIHDVQEIDCSNQAMKPNMNSLFERMYNNIDIYFDELHPDIEEFNPNKRQRND